MIFGFISLVLFGWLLFPRVTGWIVFLIAISLVSALGSSSSFEKQTYLHGDQQKELLDRRTHLGAEANSLASFEERFANGKERT
jgi:hypothetical protein